MGTKGTSRMSVCRQNILLCSGENGFLPLASYAFIEKKTKEVPGMQSNNELESFIGTKSIEFS
jgi:hypothetical protein